MADLGYFGWVSIHANFAILKGQLEAKSLGKVGKVIYIPPPAKTNIAPQKSSWLEDDFSFEMVPLYGTR